ncbi:lichenicidin A2 family type 2 lantibiotic [Enterococcus sp. AZ177]|uniref:lichenicidin A2 family type 2 lantibiotic n=1 Tax=unclassified Enterococcus TaxID=2608891 RepID=UPI003D2FE9D9
MEKIVGQSFEELSKKEMEAMQGSGDVQAETTPVCAISATVAANSAACAGVGAGIGTGITIVLTFKRC